MIVAGCPPLRIFSCRCAKFSESSSSPPPPTLKLVFGRIMCPTNASSSRLIYPGLDLRTERVAIKDQKLRTFIMEVLCSAGVAKVSHMRR